MKETVIVRFSDMAYMDSSLPYKNVAHGVYWYVFDTIQPPGNGTIVIRLTAKETLEL